jgi:alkylation response protein AidB-like acyl-CoA dehydrogenase
VTRRHILDLARNTGAARDPVRRQHVAKLVCALEVNRMTTLRAKAAARAGRPAGPEGSGAKIRNSEFLRDLGRFAVDVLGAASVAGDAQHEWQTLFLTGPSFSIRGGTDEIQRNILGERVLGLPPEPKVDKDTPFAQRSRG